MRNIKIVNSPDKLDESLEYLYKQEIIGFDTETTGLDPHSDKILLIQLGNQYKQFVYDVYALGATQVLKVIDYLRQPKVLKVGHFLQFDYSMIKTHYGYDLPNFACTQVGSSLLTKGIINADNSLKGCLNKYLNVKKDKTVRKSFAGMKFGDPISEEQIIYSAEDVEHLIPLYEKIHGLLKSRGMELLAELEYETVRVAGDLNVNGIYLDKDMWLKLKDKAREEVEEAEEALDLYFKPYCSLDIFGKTTINYNSPTQLKPVLQKITGELLEDTSERTLSRIDHPAITSLLEYRGAVKKVTTYGEEFVKKHINRATGRVHSNFRQLGTDSGRMASRSPNMQNIPSDDAYRACFRAQDEENYRIISADFSG